MAPPPTAKNRDRLTINDNNAAFARNLNWDYLDTAGDLNILANVANAGLAGPVNPLMPVNVRSMETVIFNSTGINDVERVTGTTANDRLTVGLLNNNSSATVFLGGTPYLAAPPDTVANSRPGLAGGGSGPDLLINGIAPATGLRLNGGGIPPGGGDRAIVYAASENALLSGGVNNIFGFGAGVLIPGFGVGSAYDAITVNDSSVTTTNNGFGALTSVLLDTASFVQGTPPSSTQQAALIVNSGDEAAPNPASPAATSPTTSRPRFPATSTSRSTATCRR